MTCYTCWRGWLACVSDVCRVGRIGRVLAYVACQRRWCANLGYVVDMLAWVTYGIRGDVVDVPTWVMWLCASIRGVLRWWIAWVILEEILVVSQVVSLVTHYFSNSFQKLEQEFSCRSCTLRKYLIFQSFPWIFKFKNILKLFPELIQNFGIFMTRDILRTLSIYPVEIQDIKIPDTFKILLY